MSRPRWDKPRLLLILPCWFACWLACWPWSGPAAADLLADLPAPWHDRLAAIADADVSGAEPLMQQAIAAARGEIDRLLAKPERQSDPDALASAYGRLGALLLLLEVEAQADACLRNAMVLQPDAFRWPYYAGYLAMLAGNLDPAVDYLETARAIDPDYPALYLRLGKVRFDRGELAAARAALERVQGVPELASPANYYLGQIALQERRNSDAIRLLEAALVANPDASEVHYPLAQAYRAVGDNAQARDHLARFQLRSVAIADPLVDALQAASRRSVPAFQRAIHAVQNGDYAAAVDEFAAGLEADPNNAAARISYARVLYLEQQRDAAAEQLQRALDLEPENPLGYFLQAVMRQQQADSAAAEALYARALERDPRHGGALFHLANLHFSAGRYAQAATAYRQVLAADAAVAPARLLALVAERRAGTDEADTVAALEALIDAQPRDNQLRYALARLLAAADDAALRDPPQALRIAADLMLQQPIAPHQGLLALAQAAAGRFDDAIETERRLLAMPEWMLPPPARDQARRELAAYTARELPLPAWPVDDPLLSPPPFDAERVFRDYPAIKPY
jgi:tetratricopeptide (TPR) repeat protein